MGKTGPENSLFSLTPSPAYTPAAFPYIFQSCHNNRPWPTDICDKYQQPLKTQDYMLNLLSTAIPLLGSYLSSQKQKQQAQEAWQEQQQQYEQELSQLNSLFNRTYYSNMLDRSDVRSLLGNLRDQMTETTQNLKNQASITGATPEAVTAAQKAQNQAYGRAVSQVAGYATTWKENALQNYLTARKALEAYYQPVKSNYMSNILGKSGFNASGSPLTLLKNMFN